MEKLKEQANNKELYDLKINRLKIYDTITLSSKSKTIVILRTLIISLCCFFFPLEAAFNNRLQDIEMNLYVENNLLSFLKINNNDSFQKLINILTNIFASKDGILVYISLIYSIVHPFIGLKLILISSVTQYFVILLQILFQAHRPFWDLEQVETIFF